jgi:hypothetical protein
MCRPMGKATTLTARDPRECSTIGFGALLHRIRIISSSCTIAPLMTW